MAQKFLTDIEVTRGLVDSSGNLGYAGQVLSSTGTETSWVTNTASSTVVYQNGFTGDNSTVDFTLSVAVTDENITQVYIDGVYQNKDTYSVSNTTLTFSTAPPTNADIEVITFSTATSADDLQAGVVIIPVKNTHTASIAKGQPVYITGNVGSSTRLQIAPADASNSAKMPAAGLLLQTLAVNAEGYVVTGGYLTNITTDTIDGTSTSSNDTVYVKSGGGLTMTKPTGTNLIQNIAKIARSASGNAGSLLVSSILRTNDVPNITNDYFWLGNSSGVATPTEFTSSVRGLISVSGNALSYNSSTGIITSNYEESPTFTGNVVINGTFTSQGIDDNANATAITINGNEEIGIGTTSPFVKLHVETTASQIARFSYNSTNYQDLTYEGSNIVGGSHVFKIGGSEKMRLGTSGNLGINQTSPASSKFTDSNNIILDIKGKAINRGGIINLRTSDSSKEAFLANDGGLLQIGMYTNNDITFYTNNTERMRIDSSGRVSVNDTVSGNFLTNYDTKLLVGGEVIARSLTTNESMVSIGGDSNGAFIKSGKQDGSLTDRPLNLITGEDIRMRIDSSGNVAINSTSGYVPNLGGSIKFKVTSNANENTNIIIENANNGTSASSALVLGSYGADFTIRHTSAAAGGDLIFSRGTNERMRIDSSGDLYVGGTTNYGKVTIEQGGDVSGLVINNTTAHRPRLYLRDAGGAGYSEILANNDLYLNASAVGIGTSSPTRKLSVVKDTTITGGFNDISEFLDTTIGVGGSVSLNVGRANSTKNLGKMAFKYAGSGSNSNAINWGFYDADNLMTLLANGNLGVSTTSPSERLTVDGNLKVLKGDDARIYINDVGDSSTILLRSDGANTSIGTDSNHDLQIHTNGSERMRITSGGDINSNGRVKVSGGNTDQYYFEGSRNGVGVTYRLYDNANNIYHDSYTSQVFRLNQIGGSGGNLIITGGNVGIGNSSPSAPLTVGNYQSTHHVNSASLPQTPGNHLINLTPPSTTNYYGGGISWSEGTNTAASINAVDAGAGGALHLAFATGNNTNVFEQMRITNGGDVLMGGHAANGSINPVLNGYGFQGNGLATGVCNFSGTNEMFVLNQRDGTGTTQLEFRNGNVERGRIEWTTSATTYNTISDYRLKENINNLTDSLSKINQLQPKSFNFISDPNELRIGFIAHEVQEIVPQAVTGTKDEIRKDNTPKYQGLDNSMLVPLLVGAIKEQQEIINDLKNRIQALENN